MPTRTNTPRPACVTDDELLRNCSVTRLRRSGPGGQHRNKVETAVRLEHEPTGVVAEASERRSQADNHRVAVRRLRLALALRIRTPLDHDAPSSLWSGRCRAGKILISAEHADFPCVLAEALDTLLHFQWELREAAGFLGCTPSQLAKLLRKEPAAFELVNGNRRELGLNVLK